MGFEILEESYTYTKHKYFTCLCECDTLFEVRSNQLKTKKSCGCHNTVTGNAHREFEGFGEISKDSWSILQRGALDRKLEFNISMEYCWNKFLEQDKKCALSGLPLMFNPSYKTKADRTASLDRIDSTKGYVEGNIQWVHKLINFAKKNIDNNLLIAICNLVANKNPISLDEAYSNFDDLKHTYKPCKIRFASNKKLSRLELLYEERKKLEQENKFLLPTKIKQLYEPLFSRFQDIESFEVDFHAFCYATNRYTRIRFVRHENDLTPIDFFNTTKEINYRDFNALFGACHFKIDKSLKITINHYVYQETKCQTK